MAPILPLLGKCDHKGMIVPTIFRQAVILKGEVNGPKEEVPVTVTVQAICVNPACGFVFKFGMPGEAAPKAE